MVQRRNNIIMVRLPNPKSVILRNRRIFLVKYERRKKKKGDLPANVTTGRRYKKYLEEADNVVEECKELEEK